MNQKKFRIILLAAFLLRILWLILAYAAQRSLPPDLLEQKVEMIRTWHSSIPGWVSVLNLFLPFFALMALYHFTRFSREFFAALIVIGYFLAIPLGPSIEPRIVI